jgi:hypothetical protein
MSLPRRSFLGSRRLRPRWPTAEAPPARNPGIARPGFDRPRNVPGLKLDETLAQRHDGKFPDDYVSNVLKNGVKTPAHGSGEMPVWGPMFETMSRWKALCPGIDETPVSVRITNLTNYLKSIQKK